MTYARFYGICMQLLGELKALAPKDTGNLAYNAIRFEWIDEYTFKMYVDGRIAPYMEFTNAPWTAARWNGRKNPNEGWFDRAAEYLAQRFAQLAGGQVT